jgi:ABC-2 type transport system permease protein
MSRFRRTLWQSLVTPVITTSLYFVVFGAAIGSRMTEIDGVTLRRLHRAGPHHAVDLHREPQQRLVRHLPAALHRHDLRVLSAPVSPLEIVLAYVGAAATKSVILGVVILATANLFVPVTIEHPCGWPLSWC